MSESDSKPESENVKPLINLDTGNNGTFIDHIKISPEKRKAQQKAEKIHFNAELKKLTSTLDKETKNHEKYQEELTKQQNAIISEEFQEKVDSLHLSRQIKKTESYNKAIINADNEMKKIKNSEIQEPLKQMLIDKITLTLTNTLKLLDS